MGMCLIVLKMGILNEASDTAESFLESFRKPQAQEITYEICFPKRERKFVVAYKIQATQRW